MQKVVVTGAEGFIGKHLVQGLTGEKFSVIGVDIQSGFDIRDTKSL